MKLTIFVIMAVILLSNCFKLCLSGKYGKRWNSNNGGRKMKLEYFKCPKCGTTGVYSLEYQENHGKPKCPECWIFMHPISKVLTFQISHVFISKFR
jgi:uncharacterized OB-fold protein